MEIQLAHHGQRNMSKIGYADWDIVVKACEKEFSLIDRTRISMDVAEQCQRVTYALALKERKKYKKPKPAPVKKPDSSSVQAPIESPKHQ